MKRLYPRGFRVRSVRAIVLGLSASVGLYAAPVLVRADSASGTAARVASAKPEGRKAGLDASSADLQNAIERYIRGAQEGDDDMLLDAQDSLLRMVFVQTDYDDPTRTVQWSDRLRSVYEMRLRAIDETLTHQFPELAALLASRLQVEWERQGIRESTRYDTQSRARYQAKAVAGTVLSSAAYLLIPQSWVGFGAQAAGGAGRLHRIRKVMGALGQAGGIAAVGSVLLSNNLMPRSPAEIMRLGMSFQQDRRWEAADLANHEDWVADACGLGAFGGSAIAGAKLGAASGVAAGTGLGLLVMVSAGATGYFAHEICLQKMREMHHDDLVATYRNAQSALRASESRSLAYGRVLPLVREATESLQMLESYLYKDLQMAAADYVIEKGMIQASATDTPQQKNLLNERRSSADSEFKKRVGDFWKDHTYSNRAARLWILLAAYDELAGWSHQGFGAARSNVDAALEGELREAALNVVERYQSILDVSTLKLNGPRLVVASWGKWLRQERAQILTAMSHLLENEESALGELAYEDPSLLLLDLGSRLSLKSEPLMRELGSVLMHRAAKYFTLRKILPPDAAL